MHALIMGADGQTHNQACVLGPSTKEFILFISKWWQTHLALYS